MRRRTQMRIGSALLVALVAAAVTLRAQGSYTGIGNFFDLASQTVRLGLGSSTLPAILFYSPTNSSTATAGLVVSAPSAARTYTVPDFGSNDSFAGIAATQTLTNKTLTAPVLSGSVTGTYTLAGTPTVTSPTITGAALSSGNYIGYPAVQSSASLGGSPVTLTAAQCGQAFALDAATGVVYLLPSTFPTAGCTYDFYVTVSVTSNAHEIETNSGSHFFGGAPLLVAAAATAVFQCNGTSHIAYKTNGTTTGGLIGTHIRVNVVSSTVAWLDGIDAGSGTLATPCSTTN